MSRLRSQVADDAEPTPYEQLKAKREARDAWLASLDPKELRADLAEDTGKLAEIDAKLAPLRDQHAAVAARCQRLQMLIQDVLRSAAKAESAAETKKVVDAEQAEVRAGRLPRWR